MKQLLHSVHHCMYLDPCRRFTLGATIEDTLMRLCMYTRSMIIVSESFDFNSVRSILFIDGLIYGLSLK